MAINSLSPKMAKLIKEGQIKLSLHIELPITGKSIPAQAKPSWFEDKTQASNKYFVGLIYEKIDSGDNAMLMRYAKTRKLFVPVYLQGPE